MKHVTRIAAMAGAVALVATVSACSSTEAPAPSSTNPTVVSTGVPTTQPTTTGETESTQTTITGETHHTHSNITGETRSQTTLTGETRSQTTLTGETRDPNLTGVTRQSP